MRFEHRHCHHCIIIIFRSNCGSSCVFFAVIYRGFTYSWKRLRLSTAAAMPFSAPTPFRITRAASSSVADGGQESLANREGKFAVEACDCFTISLNTAEIGEDMDAEVIDIMEAMQGRYWKVGDGQDGSPCFRQEAQADKAAVHGHQLFLHKTQEGWFVSRSLVESKKGEQHMAWLGAGATPAENGKVHVPFWQKKANAMVLVAPQHMFAEELCAALHAEMAILTDEAKGGGGGKARGKSEDKGKNGPPAPSGWLNKCRALMEAVLAGQHDDALLIAEAYSEHPSMKAVRSGSSPPVSTTKKRRTA